MVHRRSAQADRDLDDIWYRIATESGNLPLADRIIDKIAGQFLRLAQFPELGRTRDHDFGAGRRSWAATDYIIVYAVSGADVLILRVVHGRRDIAALL